jgi:hypothetical protein
MAKPYYTSNTLIEAVKRKMAIPIAQVTFADNDILAFANEEMFLEQVPSILQYHEEYLVFSQNVPMIPKQSRYPIPNRAIGMKLRDVFYRDLSGQLVQMSRINPDDRSFFEVNSNTTPIPIHYYLQNNTLVITPEVTQNATGNLVFSYYLRPNSLVTDDQAAICTSFTKTIVVDNTTIVSGNTIVIGTHITTAGVDFAIGANSAATAANLSSYLGTLTDHNLASSVSNNIVSVAYSTRGLVFSTSNVAGFAIQASITINTTTMPSGIVAGGLVDLLQTDGGHSTLAFDVLLASNSVSPTSITLAESQLPSDFVVGDYICSQYECIVPQVPTDLHNLLAERTCARILESLGDKEGLQAANTKIANLESKQATILDSRVEGSPMKVLNRTGLLRSSRIRFGRRG